MEEKRELKRLHPSESYESAFDLALRGMRDEDFQTIRALVYERFGIALSDIKKSLVVGRLQKALKARGMTTFAEYCSYLANDTTGKAVEELATFLTTNHTYFFREEDHFSCFVNEALPSVMRARIEKGEREFRVWCAGCSSGEEAYTLALLIKETLGAGLLSWKPGLLATDISTRALKLAQQGGYSDERIGALPSQYRDKYFRRLGESQWGVEESLKRAVTFRLFNLMTDPFPFKKQFDIIFCRNVMIYFDQDTRDALVQRFFDVTSPGGYLFIGHSETIRQSTSGYRYLKPAVYRKGV